MKQTAQWIDQLTDSSHIGILVVDSARNNLFVNARLCEMFAYTKEELLSSTAEVFHIDHKHFLNFADIAFKAVLQGTPLKVDYQFKRKDGSLFWIHIAGDPIKNKEEVLWTMVDITQKVEAQEQEKKLKERLELALLGNNDAIWDYDLNSGDIYYSPRWKEMIGYKDSELQNEASIWNEHVHKEDEKRVLDEIQEHLDAKRDFVDIEYRLQHKEGYWIWIRTRAKAVFDENKQAVRLIGTNTDITEQKKIQLKSTQLAQIMEQLHESVNATDMQGNIVSWNRASEKMFGYTAEEMIGENISILTTSSGSNNFPAMLETIKKEGILKFEIELQTKSKELIFVLLTLSFLKDENNIPTHIIGYAQDITKSTKAEKELAESNYNLKQYIEAIDKLDIGLFVVDEDYTVRYMNKTMIKWFGDQSGKVCYSSVAQLDEPCPYCKLDAVINEKQKVTYDPTTPDGQSFDIVATAIKNSDGTSSKMEVIRNVTEQKNIQRELYHQAHYDALTALPNRILFNERLAEAIKKAEKQSLKLALLFIDLDHFKEMNDSLGHSFGDEILKVVAEKLDDILDEHDSVARLGGDEFVIVLEELQDSQEASLKANEILSTLSVPMKIEDHTIYISSSIGISVYPDDGITAQNLLKFADSAMYKAKDEGRNNYQYYNCSMTEQAFERVVMETSLREALDRGEFTVYYQAQVNACSNTITGLEALVRWNHPSLGLVSPAKFIPLAESTGLIVELDRFVMKSAMTQLVKWYDKGLNPGVLSLNLAMKQLQKKDFVEFLKELMQKTGCRAEHLGLEVTEGQIMVHPEYAIKVLQSISDMNIELAIDDFGTGYSSLAYLKRLPIDKLKIDQAFIQNLPDDEEDIAIVKAIIALAENLNLKIIAEGIETQAQKDFIVASGCENIQGYFYAKPLAAKEFEILLKKGVDKTPT